MTGDREQIEKIIRDTFDAIGWTDIEAPDWAAFAAPIRDDAIIIPSARPIAPVTIPAFVARMTRLRDDGVMKSFAEAITAMDVKVFGTIATARVAYAVTINGKPDGAGMNAFLFVKDKDRWSIAALAWDNASETNPIPTDLGGPS